MKVLRIVCMGTFGRRRVKAEAGIIEGFEADASGVITHDCVSAKEVKEGWAFDVSLIRSGDCAQEIFLLAGWEAHEFLTVRFEGEGIDERKAAAELKLNIGIVSDHVVDEFDDARFMRAGGFITGDDEFGEMIEQLVFGGREELRLVRGCVGRC